MTVESHQSLTRALHAKLSRRFFSGPTLKAEMSGTVHLPSRPELQQHTEARDTLK